MAPILRNQEIFQFHFHFHLNFQHRIKKKNYVKLTILLPIKISTTGWRIAGSLPDK